MTCEYYKNCYAYDAEKDVCNGSGECRVYDQLFMEHQRKVESGSATVDLEVIVDNKEHGKDKRKVL